MFNINQRPPSNSAPYAAAAASLLALTVTSPAAAGDPAYQHLMEHAVETAYVVDEGYIDAQDHVWLELDSFAAEISVPGDTSNDLLEKLRRDFSLEPVMNNRVEAELKWFVRNPQYLNRVFTRAQRSVPAISVNGALSKSVRPRRNAK